MQRYAITMRSFERKRAIGLSIASTRFLRRVPLQNLSEATVKLDGGAMWGPQDAFGLRQRAVLLPYFTLPASLRQALFFNERPWSLPLQMALSRAMAGARTVAVEFRQGPLAGFRFECQTSEKFFLLGRHYERENWELLLSLAHRGDIIYDVGANIGFWVLALARLAGKEGHIVALEPAPQNFERLQRNIFLNHSQPDLAPITSLAVAAGEEAGVMPFLEHGTGSRVWRDGAARQHCIQVAMKTLDQLVYAESHPAPALVLMDVEGYAGGVLRGASRLLAEKRPVVMAEVHHPEEREQVQEALAKQGYRTSAIHSERLFPHHLLSRPA